MKYTIDATNKKVGRVATEAAVYLMGKNSPSFKRNVTADVKVEITNAGKASIAHTKKSQKTYARYSGYPGGLRKPTMTEVIEKKGHSEIFKEAVWGMLPKNKLRSKMIQNLTITE
jgi:large subunit ribosomal protein L13